MDLFFSCTQYTYVIHVTITALKLKNITITGIEEEEARNDKSNTINIIFIIIHVVLLHSDTMLKPYTRTRIRRYTRGKTVDIKSQGKKVPFN